MKSVLGIAVRPTTHVCTLPTAMLPFDNPSITVAICPNGHHFHCRTHETRLTNTARRGEVLDGANNKRPALDSAQRAAVRITHFYICRVLHDHFS